MHRPSTVRRLVTLAAAGAALGVAAPAFPAPAGCDVAGVQTGFVADYRPGLLVLHAGDEAPALVARWNSDAASEQATARFEYAVRDEVEALQVAPSVPVPLRRRADWDAVLNDALRGLAPAAPGTAALVTIEGVGFAFYLDEAGTLQVSTHEAKPAERRIVRTVGEGELASRAMAVLRQRYPGCAALFFESGSERDPSYAFFDATRGQSVLVAPPVSAAGGADGLLHTLLRFPDTVLLRGQLFGILTRPVSSTARLAWLATQTAVTLPPPVPIAGPPALPVTPHLPMDPVAWERRLDRLDVPPPSWARIEPLIDGEAFFTRLVQSLQDAKHEITIRLFIFDNDDDALRLADLLKRRSAEVRVRVLVDAIGTLGAGQAAPPGAASRPTVDIVHYLRHDSRVEVRETPNPWLVSDHTKTLIVDGRIAYLGGMNIGHEYRRDWHDMMVELEGPLVARLEHDFEVAWAYAGPWGDLAYLGAVGHRTGDGGGAAPGMVAVRPLYTRTLDAQVLRAQTEAMHRARSVIWVEQPYVSDDGLVRALVAARARGVDVRVVLPSAGDSRLMDSANRVAARTLVQGGVRVYVYPGMTHVKAALYDGWACVGSANFDKLSLRVNRETNVATSAPAFVGRLRQELFDVDFARSRELSEPPSVGWGAYLAGYLGGQL